MRFPAVVVPAILVLAGAFYFFDKAKASSRQPADNARSPQTVPAPIADLVADEYDRELVRTLLESPGLRKDQTDSLVNAAGRRYIRRKMAYAAAQQEVAAGRAAAGGLEPLRLEMESARKVCDFAVKSLWHDREVAAVARDDWELERRLAYIPSTMLGLAERYDGPSAFTEADMAEMERAFHKTFGKPMPVSARGESAVHHAMGFDHTGRFDVALSPSQPEGVWARRYLTERHVTFLAFHSAVPGKATGAHIHIGPPSTRVPKS